MRVLAAMSGGVDSSVVAGLLAEAGHEVIGATLQLYDHGAATGRKGACCAGQDIHDARRVADHFGIPHYVIDAESRFRGAVIAPFADSYAAGETPVPCIACNQSVKFGDLLDLAADLGAEAMATGHYVRRIEGAHGPELHRAADPARDQLARSLFPLGAMPDKDAVRAEADRMGLPVSRKPDSQDICFVPAGSYADVVARLRPDATQPGEIIDADGTIRGRHDGILNYTIGQSRRLGNAAMRDGERQAVIALDPKTRRVVIGPRSTGSRLVHLRDVNWLAEPVARRCRVKLRARETPQPALVTPMGSGAEILLDVPALAAPGQACVFYEGDRVLGGGFITRAEAAIDPR